VSAKAPPRRKKVDEDAASEFVGGLNKTLPSLSERIKKAGLRMKALAFGEDEIKKPDEKKKNYPGYK
jgi:hypothetical protein